MHNFNSKGYLNPHCRLMVFQSATHAGYEFKIYNKYIIFKGMASYAKFRTQKELIHAIVSEASQRGITIVGIDEKHNI